MRDILDFFVSDILEKPVTFWVLFGIMALLLVIGARAKGKIKSALLGSFVGALFLVVFFYVFFLNLLNPLFFGYGKVAAFDITKQEGTSMVGVDHLVMSDSDGGGIFFYRLHIIDALTGTTTVRTMVGKDFIGIEKISDGKVWLKFKNRTATYDAVTGQEIL